ncbi:spondin domain-containing protein [Crocosphaera sp.]|uniref:spondin domain-containing protein n=1 Tax=Crocosphaera sp. TaxID=2729996 RepID=UPI002622B405|nr:spondin domain-containing protein [Crocosphaera sp.]MDJ0580354.1 spondin domain-containing protein [Crocosphaera sp.]
MINLFKNTNPLLMGLTFASIFSSASAVQALTLKVEIENLGPNGGVALTPVWVGFHDGSFDSYNTGLPSERGLEQIAEDGIPTTISEDFLNNLTYVQGGASGIFSSSQVGTRVDGGVGDGPITAGTTVTTEFQITPDDSNRYFSYASMVLPSNDYFIANGNPFAHNLTSLFTGEDSSISFLIGQANTINDAGTEVNDFATSAGNGLFQPGLPDGQPEPGIGEPQNGLNVNVANPYANFLNTPADFDTNFASLNFNNTDLYPNGIARVTITTVAVPESSTTVGLIAIAGLFLGAGLRRRHHSK